jgi:polyphenol oxidase
MTAPLDVIKDDGLLAIDAITHGFFTRNGGRSQGIYQSLNTGFGSDDDPDAVSQNRTLCLKALDLDADALVTVHQVHSAKAVIIDGPHDSHDSVDHKADAMVTNQRGVALGILTADCVPILMASQDGTVIGAAHAGWRGALSGIIEATLDAMESIGANGKTITAAIGPSIGQQSYEVGPEFPAPFLADDPAAITFFKDAPRTGHYLFDLGGYTSARLLRRGITVCHSRFDTCALEEQFFSYRRSTLNGEAGYGRNLSVIARRA